MEAWMIFSEMVRALLMMSLVGGVLTLLIWLARRLLRGRITRHAQYRLWLVALLGFLLPFSEFLHLPVTSPLTPVQTLLDSHLKTTVERRDQLAWELYDRPYDALDAYDQVGIIGRVGYLKGAFNDHILVILLVGGGTYFAVDVLCYPLWLVKMRRRRRPVGAEEERVLRAECARMGRRHPPRLYRNPLAPTPMLVGLFRPVIYLPDREETPEVLALVLRHELIHLRRGDVPLKWLVNLTLHLHWFNPAVYLLRRMVDRDCELACDERVIAGLDRADKQRYGETLIEMAAAERRPALIVSTTLCEEKRTLQERLGAIMRSRPATRAMGVLAAVLLLLLGGVAVVLGSTAADRADRAAALRDRERLAQAGATPAGLTLTLDADRTAAEFHLVNGSEWDFRVDAVNCLERREGDRWIAVADAIPLYPPDLTAETLPPGAERYGMLDWRAEGITLIPGDYRFRLLGAVTQTDVWADAVALEAHFTLLSEASS